jgi:hypothetical protein
MKKQTTMVLFAIALLLGVIALTGSVQAGVNATQYQGLIEEKQPVNTGSIKYVLKAVDEQWTKGTEYPTHVVGIWTTRSRYPGGVVNWTESWKRDIEIMYWQKDTRYLIDIHLNETGYVVGNVTLYRWGRETETIPDALANQSLAKLFPVVDKSTVITEAGYKKHINDNCEIDLGNIRFTGNVVHQEWIKGSTMNTNTLIYWDKYKKLGIILTLDSSGKVQNADFSVNGKRAVKEIPRTLANQSLNKLGCLPLAEP